MLWNYACVTVFHSSTQSDYVTKSAASVIVRFKKLLGHIDIIVEIAWSQT